MYEVATPNAGEAYAGQAAIADDASTAFLNPAGMTRLSGRHMLFGGQLALLSMNFHPSGSNPEIDNAGRTLVMPGAYLVQGVGSRLRFGFSLNVPFGSALDYPPGWEGRYFINHIQLEVVEARPSVALRINRLLSIGGGVSIERAGVDKGFDVRNVFDPGFADGAITADLHGSAVGGAAGILVEPREGTRFGVTYRSGTDFELRGKTAAVNIGPNLAAVLAPTLVEPTPLHLPAGANVSVLHSLTTAVTILADAGWTNWRHFGERTVRLPDGSAEVTDWNWRDTWRAGVGLRYRFSERLELQAGTSYDSSPVSAWNRTPEVPADRQVRIAAGVRYAIRPSALVGLTYSYLNLGKAAIRGLEDPLAGGLSGRYSSARLPFLSLTLTLSPRE